MPASDTATARRRYDGPTFRRLREERGVALTTLIHSAAERIGGEVFQVSHEHVRQWERGQRNISARLASTLASTLSTITGDDIKPAHFASEDEA